MPSFSQGYAPTQDYFYKQDWHQDSHTDNQHHNRDNGRAMPPHVDHMMRMDRHGNYVEDRHNRRSYPRHSGGVEDKEALAAAAELGKSDGLPTARVLHL